MSTDTPKHQVVPRSNACPFCGQRWTVARRCSEYENGSIVRFSATCPCCCARVDGAGHGLTPADATADAVSDFDTACARRIGTDKSAWAITPRSVTRRRGPR